MLKDLDCKNALPREKKGIKIKLLELKEKIQNKEIP